MRSADLLQRHKTSWRDLYEREAALLMEFVLHGLAAYSLISKKVVEGRIEFKDLIGSMVNLGSTGSSLGGEDEDLDAEEFN